MIAGSIDRCKRDIERWEQKLGARHQLRQNHPGRQSLINMAQGMLDGYRRQLACLEARQAEEQTQVA